MRLSSHFKSSSLSSDLKSETSRIGKGLGTSDALKVGEPGEGTEMKANAPAFYK